MWSSSLCSILGIFFSDISAHYSKRSQLQKAGKAAFWLFRRNARLCRVLFPCCWKERSVDCSPLTDLVFVQLPSHRELQKMRTWKTSFSLILIWCLWYWWVPKCHTYSLEMQKKKDIYVSAATETLKVLSLLLYNQNSEWCLTSSTKFWPIYFLRLLFTAVVIFLRSGLLNRRVLIWCGFRDVEEILASPFPKFPHPLADWSLIPEMRQLVINSFV